MYLGGQVDSLRADFRIDTLLVLCTQSRSLAAKSSRHVERGNSDNQTDSDNAAAYRNAHGDLAGGRRHPRDNRLHVGLFLAVDNPADDVLALRVNLGVDGNGFRHRRDNGRYLRGDCSKFGRADVVDGRSSFIGLLFRRPVLTDVDKRIARCDADQNRHFQKPRRHDEDGFSSADSVERALLGGGNFFRGP